MQSIDTEYCLLCGVKLTHSTSGKKKYCCIEHRKQYYRENKIKPKTLIPEPIVITYNKDIDYIEVPMRDVFESYQRSSIISGFKKFKIKNILNKHKIEVNTSVNGTKQRVNTISFVTVNQFNKMIEEYDKLYRENNCFLSYRNARITNQKYKEKLIRHIKENYEDNS